MAGVFAYWMLRRRSWKKTLVTVLAVMAFVPVLNASFSAFNSNLHTLVFSMPVLRACMTAEVLEEEDSTAFTRGTLLSLVCTALFILFCFLPVEDGGKWSFTAVCENRNLLTREIIATLFGSAVLLVILFVKRRCGNLFAAKTAAAAETPEGGRPETPAKGAAFTAAGILKPGTLCLALTIVCCITSTNGAFEKSAVPHFL